VEVEGQAQEEVVEVEGQVQVEAQNGAEVPKLLKTKVK